MRRRKGRRGRASPRRERERKGWKRAARARDASLEGDGERYGDVEGDGVWFPFFYGTMGGFERQRTRWEQILPGGWCRRRWEEPGPLIEESDGPSN